MTNYTGFVMDSVQISKVEYEQLKKIKQAAEEISNHLNAHGEINTDHILYENLVDSVVVMKVLEDSK